jgi:hypothetical protein
MKSKRLSVGMTVILLILCLTACSTKSPRIIITSPAGLEIVTFSAPVTPEFETEFKEKFALEMNQLDDNNKIICQARLDLGQSCDYPMK